MSNPAAVLTQNLEATNVEHVLVKSIQTLSQDTQGTQELSTTIVLTVLPCNQDNKTHSNVNEEQINRVKEISVPQRIWEKFCAFYSTFSFLLLTLLAILIAFAYPPLGAIYVAPDITASWIAIILIFGLGGLGIRTDELLKSFSHVYFNIFVQVFNFGMVSGIIYGVSRCILYFEALPQSLIQGMIIFSCVPLFITAGLTSKSQGDMGALIVNVVIGNFVGVFLSPLLVLGYLGQSVQMDLGLVFLELCARIPFPIIVAQILVNTVPAVKGFVEKYRKYFTTVQESLIVYLLYTVFSQTFYRNIHESAHSVVVLIAILLITLSFMMVVAWWLLQILFPTKPKLQVMGLFGCTTKTVAFGVSLIHVVYRDDPHVGNYTLPLVVWHSLVLLLGSAISPQLAAYVQRKEEQLEKTKKGKDSPVSQILNMHPSGLMLQKLDSSQV